MKFIKDHDVGIDELFNDILNDNILLFLNISVFTESTGSDVIIMVDAIESEFEDFRVIPIDKELYNYIKEVICISLESMFPDDRIKYLAEILRNKNIEKYSNIDYNKIAEHFIRIIKLFCSELKLERLYLRSIGLMCSSDHVKNSNKKNKIGSIVFSTSSIIDSVMKIRKNDTNDIDANVLKSFEMIISIDQDQDLKERIKGPFIERIKKYINIH